MARKVRQTHKSYVKAALSSKGRRKLPVSILNLNHYFPPIIMNYTDAQGVPRVAYGWAHLGANWRAHSELNNYVAGTATVWVTSDNDKDSTNLVVCDALYAGCTVGGYTRGNGGAARRNVSRFSWGFPSVRHISYIFNHATISRKYTIAGQTFKPAKTEKVPLWTPISVATSRKPTRRGKKT